MSFWRGRRVLITGHTGFKGTWLSLWLEHLGAEVVGYSNALPSDPCAFVLTRAEEGLTSVDGDVRDLDHMTAVFAERRPEVVFHMAAQPLVRRSYESPVETYEVNVMGTVKVLEAARRSDGVRAFVNVTSDKCYENREWVWPYRENEPVGGHDPYSNSKGCSELVTAAYRSSYFPGDAMRLASARAGNVIGGGDWAADRLVPDLMRAAVERRPLHVRNPAAVRPWQHVLNPLSGYLRLAERLHDDPAAADAWNFGPPDGDARPVSWIVERLCGLWGDGLEWQAEPSPERHEAMVLKLDSAKARALLDWRPAWLLDETLTRVVEWYRAYRDGDDMRALTLAQIEAFEAQV